MAITNNRSFGRQRKKQWRKELTSRQAKAIKRGLSTLEMQRAEWSDQGKTVFDLLAWFQLPVDDEAIQDYINREKYVVVTKEGSEIEGLQQGQLLFPIFNLGVTYLVKTQGSRSTIFLLGDDEVKWLAVCTFMNFIGIEEELKTVGFFLTRELSGYMNQLQANQEHNPTLTMDSSIEEIVPTFA